MLKSQGQRLVLVQVQVQVQIFSRGPSSEVLVQVKVNRKVPGRGEEENFEN